MWQVLKDSDCQEVQEQKPYSFDDWDERVLDETPMSYVSDGIEFQEEVSLPRNFRFQELEAMTDDEFRCWWTTNDVCRVDGWSTRPQNITEWYVRPFSSRVKQQCMMKWNMTSTVVQPVKESGVDHQVRFKTYSKTWMEERTYASMEEYRQLTSDTHGKVMSSVVAQIPDTMQVVAPADGWGLVKSFRPSAISGDLMGDDTIVKKETIRETMQRGAAGVLILSYAWSFCDSETRDAVASWLGPVIIVDVGPVFVPRQDVVSVGPNVTAYGIHIRQEVFFPDEARLRSSAPYSFNLAAGGHGWDWLDWGFAGNYAIETRPAILHCATRNVALGKFISCLQGVAVTDKFARALPYASHYLESLDTWDFAIAPVYFCPTGRTVSRLHEAYGDTYTLVARTVYYASVDIYRRFYASYKFADYVSISRVLFYTGDQRTVYSATAAITLIPVDAAFCTNMGGKYLSYVGSGSDVRLCSFKSVSTQKPFLRQLAQSDYPDECLKRVPSTFWHSQVSSRLLQSRPVHAFGDSGAAARIRKKQGGRGGSAT